MRRLAEIANAIQGVCWICQKRVEPGQGRSCSTMIARRVVCAACDHQQTPPETIPGEATQHKADQSKAE